jgi:signal transduction histidine kinase
MLSKFSQLPTVLEEVAGSVGPASRAARLAAALRRLWPYSPAYFALFFDGAEQHTVALNQTGCPLPELAALVSAALAGSGRGAGCLPLPPFSPGRVLLSHEIAADRHWGQLGVAIHAGDAIAFTALVQRLLGLLARALAERLSLAALEQRLEKLHERLLRQTALADIAELAGPLAHEFNNFLNILMLQIAALGSALPDDVRTALEKVRQQGRATADLVRAWQRARQQTHAPGRPLDLAEVIGEALQELPETSDLATAEGSRLTFVTHLSTELPAVQACSHDLRRLLTFLLRNAVAAVGSAQGVISVETEVVSNKVLLHVRDSGPPLPAEGLPALFDPHTAARAGTTPLELAACISIARRYLGKLRGANPPGGGVAVTLELPAARPEDAELRGEHRLDRPGQRTTVATPEEG